MRSHVDSTARCAGSVSVVRGTGGAGTVRVMPPGSAEGGGFFVDFVGGEGL